MTSERIRSWLLWLMMGFAVVFACQERPPTRFPHQVHLAQPTCAERSESSRPESGPEGQCLTCLNCHTTPGTSEPHRRPAPEVCTNCHARDGTEKLLASTRPPLHPEPIGHQILFSHGPHLSLPGIHGQCVSCHAGATDGAHALFPKMSQCLECHEHQQQFEKGVCTPCHAQADLSRLEPQSFMKHDLAWFRHHGDEARRDQQLCRACHAQTDCEECHDLTQTLLASTRHPEALDRDFVHRADFMTRHAIEAQSQPARCASCHTPETCDSCHLERGVSGNSRNGRSPHPPGWVGGNPASRDFHGQAARRDLLSCAGCHEQGPATNCIRCHQVGGAGGNPHPRGWKSARNEDSSMCRYCHVQ